MEHLRQRPAFGLDAMTRKQLRETRQTLLEHLRVEPDSLQALVLADVVGELDPDRDPTLAAHRMRFRAMRPADWQHRAKQLGLDHFLFHLARGLSRAGFGAKAIPVLERHAIAISEARAPAVRTGHIDAALVPEVLGTDPRASVRYHPSGHLARAAIHIDDLHHGELVLAATPGSGHLTLVQKLGGYGTMIRETYRDGGVVTILNTPWHDGEESIEPRPWTRWVEENLHELAGLAKVTAPARARRRGARRRARA